MSNTTTGHAERTRRVLAGGTVAMIGAGAGVFEAGHTIRMSTLIGQLTQAVLPLLVAIVLVYAGYWLATSGIGGHDSTRIVVYFLAGIFVAALVAGWIISHQRIRGLPFHHWSSVMVSTSIVGGLGGFVLGVSRVRRDEERQRVAAEREKLTLLNRVLRHHVLNGMAVVIGHAESQTDRTDSEIQSDLDVIADRATDVVSLVENVRVFIDRTVSEDDRSLEAVVLIETLQEELEAIHDSHPAVTTTDRVPSDVEVMADEMLPMVFDTLLANSITRGNGDDGQASMVVDVDGDTIAVSIGAGEHSTSGRETADLFEWDPWRSSNPAGGVGLSLAATIVEQYGGSIRAETDESRSATFRVELPRAA
jgi:signal transduction histidine kinase